MINRYFYDKSNVVFEVISVKFFFPGFLKVVTLFISPCFHLVEVVVVLVVVMEVEVLILIVMMMIY